jgi:hypothetical protein
VVGEADSAQCRFEHRPITSFIADAEVIPQLPVRGFGVFFGQCMEDAAVIFDDLVFQVGLDSDYLASFPMQLDQ